MGETLVRAGPKKPALVDFRAGEASNHVNSAAAAEGLVYSLITPLIFIAR
jgi:hypothetical protein